MRVALVHDHLTQNGGAEQVLLRLRRLFPTAPIYTLAYDDRRLGDRFATADIRTSFLQRLPGGPQRLHVFLPLMPLATESYDLRDYDLVISSASAFAKGVITSDHTIHVCYCHTPTRYLWGDTYNYINDLPYPKFVKSLARAILPRLRAWDRIAADRPDIMIANSEAVRRRIQKYYHRDSRVLYPPVDIAQFSKAVGPGEYFLAGGRLVSYKRFDIIIQAFNRLRLPLVIFGVGPDRRRLEAMAKSNVNFLGFVSPSDLPLIYQKAIAFINPQEEDFGITAVEAMASGRPVVAYAAGGALETVVEDQTGKFFYEQSWEALADTIIRFKASAFQADHIKKHAQRFSPDAFETGLKAIIESGQTG